MILVGISVIVLLAVLLRIVLGVILGTILLRILAAVSLAVLRTILGIILGAVLLITGVIFCVCHNDIPPDINLSCVFSISGFMAFYSLSRNFLDFSTLSPYNQVRKKEFLNLFS